MCVGEVALAWADCFVTEVNEEVRLGCTSKLEFDNGLDVRGVGERRIQAIELQWGRLEEGLGWGRGRESELCFGLVWFGLVWFHFYWSTVALQCCVSFYCTAN